MSLLSLVINNIKDLLSNSDNSDALIETTSEKLKQTLKNKDEMGAVIRMTTIVTVKMRKVRMAIIMLWHIDTNFPKTYFDNPEGMNS